MGQVRGDSPNDDGVVGTTNASDKSGVFGFSPNGVGLRGITQSSAKLGIFGSNDSTKPPTGGGAGGAGVFGLTHSPGGAGVFGSNLADKGVGVFGICNGPLNQGSAPGAAFDLDIQAGVWGDNEGGGYGVRGTSMGAQGTVGVLGLGALLGVEGFGATQGVSGQATGDSGVGVLGVGIKAGVEGQAGGASGHVGVLGRSSGLGASDPITTEALTSEAGALKAGGRGMFGIGVNVGVQGISTTGHGIDGFSISGIGVAGGAGGTEPNSVGIFGVSRGGASFAGKFQGNVDIQGNLTKSGGGFRVDHPLAPTESYLNHSFVESSERKNVYDGIAVLDEDGQAVVELPAWFEALNREVRYQLTCLGLFAPVYISRKLSNCRFAIAGGAPRMEISWQITGIRSDKWAQANPLYVEEEKHQLERGCYRHAEVYAESSYKGVVLAPVCSPQGQCLPVEMIEVD
jgi:hypothetical protein